MAQALPDRLTGMLDSLHQAEHLGNALHGKRRFGIAGAEQLAVIAVHRNAQLVGRHIGQSGDVIGHLALADQWANFIENLIQQRLHARARSRARGHPGRWLIDAHAAQRITLQWRPESWILCLRPVGWMTLYPSTRPRWWMSKASSTLHSLSGRVGCRLELLRAQHFHLEIGRAHV